MTFPNHRSRERGRVVMKIDEIKRNRSAIGVCDLGIPAELCLLTSRGG